MISYKKLLDLFDSHNISTYEIRKHHLLSESTLSRIRQGNVGIQIDNLNHLCAFFNCGPGDLFDYIPDEESEQWAKEKWRDLKK